MSFKNQIRLLGGFQGISEGTSTILVKIRGSATFVLKLGIRVSCFDLIGPHETLLVILPPKVPQICTFGFSINRIITRRVWRAALFLTNSRGWREPTFSKFSFLDEFPEKVCFFLKIGSRQPRSKTKDQCYFQRLKSRYTFCRRYRWTEKDLNFRRDISNHETQSRNITSFMGRCK